MIVLVTNADISLSLRISRMWRGQTQSSSIHITVHMWSSMVTNSKCSKKLVSCTVSTRVNHTQNYNTAKLSMQMFFFSVASSDFKNVVEKFEEKGNSVKWEETNFLQKAERVICGDDTACACNRIINSVGLVGFSGVGSLLKKTSIRNNPDIFRWRT